jgi:hypothetical protein
MSLHFPLVNVNAFSNESQLKACRRIQPYAGANKLTLDAEWAGGEKSAYSTEGSWTIPRLLDFDSLLPGRGDEYRANPGGAQA